MKNKWIIFLLSLLAAPSLSGRVFAQAPVTSYECELLPIRAHVFSASAKEVTFENNSVDDTISYLWIKPNGSTEVLAPVSYTASKPAVRIGNEALPGDGFYFGDKKMKYFGLTGGGLVYFGETDELRPTYNPYTVYTIKGAVEKFILTYLYDSKGTRVQVLATENTKVQYEIENDTLFIAYNNLKVVNDIVVSFQYAFTKDGDVSFIPVDMNLGKSYKFSYGLFAETPVRSLTGCFLSDMEGKVATTTIPSITVSNTAYPENTYRMHPPKSCEAVQNPSIGWDYVAGKDYIELGQNKMTCEAGACLFILSSKSSLTGEDLPKDGTTYATGSTIGSSVKVLKGDYVAGKIWFYNNDYKIENLQSATTYYLHAFPYYTDCSNGPKYNTTNIPVRAISTTLAPVNSVSVDAASMTDKGFTLNIDKGNADKYILAVSRRQINPSAKTVLSAKDGGYKAGDKLKFYYRSAELDESYELEILAVGSDAQYAVTNVQPNSDYYYYVWSTDNAQTKFSLESRTCGASTRYSIPAFLSFDSATAVFESGPAPAGWTLSAKGQRAFMVSKNEFEGKGRIMGVMLYPVVTENATYNVHAEAISPLIEGGSMVSVSTNFYFYTPGDLGPVNKEMREGDTVYIQYKGVSQTSWTNLYTVVKAKGEKNITTKPFFISEDFNLRYVAVSTVAATEGSGYAIAAIRNITVGSICQAVSAVNEVSQVMNDRVTLSWDDENNIPRAGSYYLRFRTLPNEEWTSRSSMNRDYTLTGLQSYTTYTLQVAAVCSEGDTSDYEEITFNTLHGIPYEFNVETVSEDVTFKTGTLPVNGAASLTSAPKAVWAPMQKGSDYYAGLEVNTDLTNPLWFNLPVLSSGMSRGKARLSLELSAWGAGNQQATFGQNDTLLVLFSTDSTFTRSNTKLQVDLSEVTPQGKMFNIDFDVKTSYQYWAIYTNLQTEDNVLVIDSLRVEWTDLNCNAATDLFQSNLGKHSIDISWTGEGVEYGIFYNNRNTDKWDTVYTHETSYTFNNLLPGTPYRYYIVVYCDADRTKQSEPSVTRTFQTEIECEVPTLELVAGSETWQGITVITKSEQTRQILIEPQNQDYCEGYYRYETQRDTVALKGLVDCGGIPYFIKVRALCPRDTSDWSEVKEFTTLPKPECGVPTNLKAEVNVSAKTATLSWTAGVNNLGWAVFLRVGNALRGDTVSVNYPTFTINNLVPDVVYTWSMMAACESPLYSKVVEGNSFGTNVGVESVQGFDKSVKVRVFENQLIIENNEGFYIKSLQAFSTDGKLLKTYPVNSAQNAYIYHSLPKGAALLRVLGENGKTATYKTIIL